MKFAFSIIIPVHNEEKTIGNLLTKIRSFSRNFASEIIVIDSGSTDNTSKIVSNKKKTNPNIKLINIKEEEFNHGTTRNLGIKFARGEYVIFLSGDVTLTTNFFQHLSNDFKLDKKTVVVFGKQIPYNDTPLIQKLEVSEIFERLDRLTDKNGVLIQNLKYPFISYNIKNYYLWYFLSDIFACYRKDFLTEHPFSKINTGEDIYIGKKIIDQGFTKIYDNKVVVQHSHSLDFWQYCKREEQSMALVISELNLKKESHLKWKIKKIVFSEGSFINKVRALTELSLYYLIKVLILIKVKLVPYNIII